MGSIHRKVARQFFHRKADIHELDEDLLGQVIEEEKQMSAKDREEMEKFVEDAKTRFRGLSRNTAYQKWQEIDEEYSDKDTKKREFSKLLRESEKIQSYIDDYLGGRDHMVYKFRDVRTEPGYREKDAVESVERIARKYYRNTFLEEQQENIREEIPEEIRQWLPEKIYIEVNEDGRIDKITDRFNQQRETLRKKIANVNLIIKRYNEVAREVKEDMKSSDELTRLSALVTAVLMETGIRPGKKGNSTIEIKNGEEIEVETFGAVTLKKEHVEFVRDNFARLEFRGKKGTINIAELNDQEVVELMREYVEDARDRESDFIFVTKDGQRITYRDMADYINERWEYISPTDFRKLKATETVLNSLYEQQEELYGDIKSFVDNEADNLKQKIVEKVSETVQEAVKEAQETLSHDNLSTTIDSYINPEVILRFLSRGEIEDDLTEAVITNERYLAFDPMVFVERAKKASASARKKQSDSLTLKDVMDGLKEDMESIADLEKWIGVAPPG